MTQTFFSRPNTPNHYQNFSNVKINPKYDNHNESDITGNVHLIPTDLWKAITGETVTTAMICQMCDLTISHSGATKTISSEALQYVSQAKDRFGSRQLQQIIETCTQEKKNEIFNALSVKLDELIFDPFANYVIQKICELATQEQQTFLLKFFLPHAKSITDQGSGCRVLQKFIENTSPQNVDQLYIALRPYFIELCLSQNGNHIIQRFIDVLPERIDEMIQAIQNHVIQLVVDNCGCRVVQRIFDHFDIAKLQLLVDEVNQEPVQLAENQYGNYVIQNILENGPEENVNFLLHAFHGHFYEFSIHKFASNVMEKCIRRVCLKGAPPEQRHEIFDEIIGKNGHPNTDQIAVMICDQFGNYVIQRILEFGTEEQQNAIYDVVYDKYDQFVNEGFARHVITKLHNLGYDF